MNIANILLVILLCLSPLFMLALFNSDIIRKTAGSLTLVNLSGFQRGIKEDETGINISSFVATVAPEFKEFCYSKTNEKRGFAIAPPELRITVEGEISGTTGLMAATFSTGVTIANTVAYFGAPSTGIYMDSATVTEERAGWKTLSAEYSSNAGIT